MRIAAAGSLQFAAGTPSWLARAAAIAEALTDNGAGDTSFALGDSLGVDQNRAVALMSHRGVIAASSLPSFGFAHASDTAKRLTSIQEQGAGAASAAADVAADVLLCDLDGGPSLPVLAAGQVSFTAGAPAFTWRSSDVEETITDSGAGDISVALGRGHDAEDCVMLITPRLVLAASALPAGGVTHTSDTAKRITLGQEQATGGASILADVDFDFVIVGLEGPVDPRDQRLQLVAMGSVISGVGPTFRVQSPAVSAIARTAAGDYDLTLGKGFDERECVVICSPRGAAAASALRAIGVTHTSDTVKRITCLQEGGGGAASALADYDFDFAVFAEAA